MSKQIAEEVAKKSGSTYYVGGFVRDGIIQKENKDVDIEIHGISPNELENILDALGNRISIGASFGVYSLKGYTLDIAMPRKETATGKGHKDFDVFVDPFIGTYNAAKRRDFTVNALMKNVLTGEIVDHFNGIADLQKGIIRHVNSETFTEDPLRVLRAAQFAARFNFRIAAETIELCKNIDLCTLSRERIEGELFKALIKADTPSVFFNSLREMNKLTEWFPELENLIGIEQNPKYHAEGDVWTHTMMVIDAAAKYRSCVNYPKGFMLSAVVHDLGKAVCTEVINGKIHSYNHESMGIPLAEEFLNRLTNEVNLKKYVLNMAKMHMKPNTIAEKKSAIKTSNKMFDRAVDPKDLIYLAAADDEGRITETEFESNTQFLLERLEIFNKTMAKPYVMGRDLIASGLKPDRNFTEILEHSHKLRLAGVEKEAALKQTLAFARSFQKKNK